MIFLWTSHSLTLNNAVICGPKLYRKRWRSLSFCLSKNDQDVQIVGVSTCTFPRLIHIQPKEILFKMWNSLVIFVSMLYSISAARQRVVFVDSSSSFSCESKHTPAWNRHPINGNSRMVAFGDKRQPWFQDQRWVRPFSSVQNLIVFWKKKNLYLSLSPPLRSKQGFPPI